MNYNIDPETGRSWSAHPGQPVADRPLFNFEDYTGAGGRRALSMQIDIRDMAAMYAEHPDLAGGYECEWNSCGGSAYVERAPCHAGDALDLLAAFEFPTEIKRAAQRAARRLVGVFDKVARLEVQRDLTAGRLDRRKLPALARHSAAGTYDPNALRPYRRTVPTPAELPTVAIVASAAFAEMWRDARYIPRVLTLTLGLLWACQAAGLNTYAALTQSHREAPHAIAGCMLAAPGVTVSPRAYGVAMHRDLWRHGTMTARAADPEGLDRQMALTGSRKARPMDIRRSWPCRNGGPAAHWARAVLGADVVIAIGQVTDASTHADAHLGAGFDIEDAVEATVRQIKSLEAKR